jgi:hypothetical protein
MVHLFTVTDRFQIEGRGCVLIPGVSCEPGDPVVRLGDRIRLRMPGGSDLDTTVRGIESIRYAKMPEKIAFPVLLPEVITKDDIPVGTEVLLLEERYETVQSD